MGIFRLAIQGAAPIVAADLAALESKRAMG